MDEEKKLDEKTLEGVSGGVSAGEIREMFRADEKFTEDFRARNCVDCIFQNDAHKCPYQPSFMAHVLTLHYGDPNATCNKRTIN